MTTDRDIVEEPGPYRDGLISALIERVRDANKGRTFYEGQDPWEYRDSLFAEEITALRAEVEHVNAANQSMLLVIEKQNRNATALRAEVEELKAEIGSMSQPCAYCGWTADDMLGHDHCVVCQCEARGTSPAKDWKHSDD